MINATEQLREEHRTIRTMLEVLKTISNILKFIRVFADRCHHGKEEDLFWNISLAESLWRPWLTHI